MKNTLKKSKYKIKEEDMSQRTVITADKPLVVTLEPTYERLARSDILYKVTANPSSASPNTDYYVCLLPNSLYLAATFKTTNTKARFINNLGRLLIKGLTISFK